jgi:hypothetical protein
MRLQRRPIPKPPVRRSTNPPKPQLLQTRRQTAEQLNVSIMTVHRMEQRGQLRSIRLNDGHSARGYHLCSEVEQLVEWLANGEAVR